jgi:hypothetical protein
VTLRVIANAAGAVVRAKKAKKSDNLSDSPGPIDLITPIG